MIPLYVFVEGDTLGLLVLAREHETVADLTERIQRAASLRARRLQRPVLRHGDHALEPLERVGETGLSALDRIDVRGA